MRIRLMVLMVRLVLIAAVTLTACSGEVTAPRAIGPSSRPLDGHATTPAHPPTVSHG